MMNIDDGQRICHLLPIHPAPRAVAGRGGPCSWQCKRERGRLTVVAQTVAPCGAQHRGNTGRKGKTINDQQVAGTASREPQVAEFHREEATPHVGAHAHRP